MYYICVSACWGLRPQSPKIPATKLRELSIKVCMIFPLAHQKKNDNFRESAD